MSSRQLLAIVLLTIMAGGTRWWLLQTRDAGRQGRDLPATRSEYTLDNFDLLVMNKQGLRSFQVESPHLEKTPGDGSVVLQQPRMFLYENGNKTWQIDARVGWISEDGEEIQLQGEVLMSKGEGTQRLTIRARDLNLYPQQELAESSQQVQISRPGTVMAGVGLKAQLKLEIFELLSEVRGDYESPKFN